MFSSKRLFGDKDFSAFESQDEEDEKECILLGTFSTFVGERFGITSCKSGSAMNTLWRTWQRSMPSCS